MRKPMISRTRRPGRDASVFAPLGVALALLAAALAPSSAVAAKRADLALTKTAFSPSTAAVGDKLVVRDKIRNRGSKKSRPSRTGFYLSKDGTKGKGDLLLPGKRKVRSIAPGARDSGKRRVRIPSSAASGAYRVIGCADVNRAVRERKETNNCRAANGKLEVTAGGTDDRVVGIGDSIMGLPNSYVDRYAARRGIDDVRKLTSGATAIDLARNADPMPRALKLIDDASDTQAVVVQVGGHDYLRGTTCVGGWNKPGCDYADGLHAVLARLRQALDADPGGEKFLAVAYYNPASGLANDTERVLDVGLRGADGRLDTAAHGDDWGQTDVIAWLGCRDRATFVDPWAAFKAGGQSLMADSLHPNAHGQAILADLLADPATGGPAPSCLPTTPFADTGPSMGDGRAHGVVEPRLAATRWWFEFGPTTAYGQSTPVRELPPSAGSRAVTADLPARPPGAFHVRLVAENELGRTAGTDQLVP